MQLQPDNATSKTNKIGMLKPLIHFFDITQYSFLLFVKHEYLEDVKIYIFLFFANNFIFLIFYHLCLISSLLYTIKLCCAGHPLSYYTIISILGKFNKINMQLR